MNANNEANANKNEAFFNKFLLPFYYSVSL